MPSEGHNESSSMKAKDLAPRHVGKKVEFTTKQGAEIADILTGISAGYGVSRPRLGMGSDADPWPVYISLQNVSRRSGDPYLDGTGHLFELDPEMDVWVH